MFVYFFNVLLIHVFYYFKTWGENNSEKFLQNKNKNKMFFFFFFFFREE